MTYKENKQSIFTNLSPFYCRYTILFLCWEVYLCPLRRPSQMPARPEKCLHNCSTSTKKHESQESQETSLTVIWMSLIRCVCVHLWWYVLGMHYIGMISVIVDIRDFINLSVHCTFNSAWPLPLFLQLHYFCHHLMIT